MPLPRFRAAIASGNWSNTATWNGGEIPGPNDVVALNDYTVDIDQNINIYELSNFDRSYTSYNSFKLMTSDIAPEGITTASFNDYRSYFPFSTSGTYSDIYLSIANPLWYAYEYPAQQPIVISRYTFNLLGYHQYDPRDWKFQGWNATTSTWVDLDTVTGQTSFTNSIYISNILSHTTAYYKYRIIVTQGRNGDGTCRFYNIRFYEKNTYYTATTLPRGTTNVTTSRTLTVGAGGLTCASFNSLMTMSSGSGTTINFNGNFRGSYTSSTSIVSINITGLGTYNFTGNILKVSDYPNGSIAINVNSACTVNVYGNVFGPGGNDMGHINIPANGATVTVFGNLEGAGGLYNTGVVRITGASNLNVYGNVSGTPDPNISYGHTGIWCSNSGANIVVVGNVLGSPSQGTSGQGNRAGMFISAANSVHITGNVTAGSFWLGSDTRFYGIYVGSVPTLTIVGTLQASLRTHALITTASIYTREVYGYNYQLSGPFVSGPSGEMPYQMTFFKLISNISNYYQFRDLNLNTTSMLSPNTVLDLPLPNNVRLGTSYGSGNYIGSLAVPAANRVSSGIAVDNTVGTAILTSGDVWNIQTSALTVAGSVGVRLKNVATIGMVGAQFEAFLKKD